MNVRIFIWSLTAALAGFLFGFDTVVISGAEKTIQSPGLHGFAIASALYGTVLVRCLAAGPHWIFAALLTTYFPKMVSSLPPGYIFSFFTGMMCLQLLWVITMVPETKNIPLEELQPTSVLKRMIRRAACPVSTRSCRGLRSFAKPFSTPPSPSPKHDSPKERPP